MNKKNTMPSYLKELEHELADAHDRIRLLVAERNTARLQADQRVSLREEFRELLGTDDIEQKVAVVRGMEERIKRLEEELNELRSDESRLLNSNGEFERRINRLLEAGDKMANSTDIREYSVAIQNWTKAKEDKP
jgi:exonuclease VII small subunit